MSEMSVRQRTLVQGLVEDLLLIKGIPGDDPEARRGQQSCASGATPGGTLSSVSRVPGVGQSAEASGVKRKAIERAEQNLCSLALELPPSMLVSTQSTGFKRLKRIFQERVQWRQWLQEHRAKWKAANGDQVQGTGRRPGEQTGPTSMEEKGDLSPGSFLDPKMVNVVEDPCRICAQPIASGNEALVCDGCQGAHHLTCLQPVAAKSKPPLERTAELLPILGDALASPELLPSLNAALAVDAPESLPVSLLPSGDWFCGACTNGLGKTHKALPPLYGRLKAAPEPVREGASQLQEESAQTASQGRRRFKPLKILPQGQGSMINSTGQTGEIFQEVNGAAGVPAVEARGLGQGREMESEKGDLEENQEYLEVQGDALDPDGVQRSPGGRTWVLALPHTRPGVDQGSEK